MSIRSIDLQVLIPRVTEVSKNQQVVENQRAVQQQQFVEEWRQISTQRQTQVQHSSHAEEGIIHDTLEQDGKPKQWRRDQKSRAKKAADEPVEVNHNDPLRGNIIDIKT